jgi:diguanylate cyclase (GGDEF)-like protein
MKPSNSTLVSVPPSEWLLYSFDQRIGKQAVDVVSHLKESHVCQKIEDIRKTWYRNNLKAIIFVADNHDAELEEWVSRLTTALPEAPFIFIFSESSNLNERKLLEIGVQDIWLLSDLSDSLFYRMVQHAITRKQVEYQTRHLAHYDALTGVANRTLFQDRLDHSLLHARREGHVVGLLTVDLDRFAVINENYGHDIGDQVLKLFAKRLSKIVRRTDTVARLNGNNFAVLLENVGTESVITEFVEKLCIDFIEPYSVGDHEIFCSISVGVETAKNADYDASKLLHRSELALRQAKHDGRNDYQFFKAKNYPPDMIRASLESSLYRALERNELSLQYQPQIRLSTKEFIGTEVLLRWDHETLGSIPPAVFIPVLEETGLINKVGEWVLTSACYQHQQWVESGILSEEATLAVNLSPRQFRQRDLADRILQVLEATKMNPYNLTIEITEGVLMDNLKKSVDTLGQLREIGVSVAIDDFGTGYSSLAYLKNLPIDYLKIDRIFVKDIVSERSDAAIANSIIALARNLDLEVIAEGVEDQNVIDILQSFGCDQYQGYFFSRPIDPEEIPALAQQYCA